MLKTLRYPSILATGASLAALCIGQASAQEIVVTASGRAAAIQDVPIAVTAITADSVQNAGITDLRAIEQVAPSYRFSTGQSNAVGSGATIRGIGTGGDNPGFESAVGFFIDGVYRARSGVALSDLPEVERIEVLRGPQGTLFGKNTTAGAISVTTRAPEFAFRSFGEASIGDYNLRSLKLGATGPVVEDALAVKLEGSYSERDGYYDDVVSGRDVNNRNRWSMRGQALWDINPDLSVRLIADAAQTDEECCTASIIQRGPVDDALDFIAQATQGRNARPPVDVDARTTSISPGRTLQEDVEEWGVSGQIDWSIGDLQFTSISAYRDWTVVRGQDIDFSAVDRAYREGYEVGFETLTQEFRLQGQSGPIDWLVGAFLGQETLTNDDAIRYGADAATFVDTLLAGGGVGGIYGTPGTGSAFASAAPLGAGLRAGLTAQLTPLLGGAAAATADSIVTGYGNALLATRPIEGEGQTRDAWEIESSTWALFTHNVISLSDKLDLTLGIRYNDETKDLSADLDAVSPSCEVLRDTAQVVGGIPVSFADITNAIGGAGGSSVLLLACNPVVNTIANGQYSTSREDKEWNGVASLGYKATEDLLLYGSYSRGYKGGGYNMDRSGLPLTFTGSAQPDISATEFDPEFVNSYEVGAKLTARSIGGVVNVALFRQEFEDFQLLAFTGFNFVTNNLKEVTSEGVELEILTRPMEGLSLTGGVTYNKTEIGDDESSIIGSDDLRGDPIANAPEWVVAGSVTYERPVFAGLNGLVYIDGRWNDDHRVQTLSRNPVTDNEAFAIFNARAGIGNEDGNWNFELFVRNLTDETYNVLAFAVPEQSGTFAVYPNEPRTYGATLRFSY